jgi:hypothetical protein
VEGEGIVGVGSARIYESEVVGGGEMGVEKDASSRSRVGSFTNATHFQLRLYSEIKITVH